MPCLICQSEDSEVLRTKLRYDVKRDVLKCGKCGFVFLSPEGGAGEAYYQDPGYRQKHGPDLTKESNCQEVFDTYSPFQGPMINCIEHLLTPETKILDVGCSTGHFLAAIKDKVGVRVGMELNPDDSHFCKKNLDFPIYTDLIEDADIKEGPFDIVTSFQVLEHVDNPIEFISNLGKHLKDDGYLYLELPNLHDIVLDQYDIPEYADFYFREPHISYFAKENLEEAVEKAGFEGTVGNVQRFNILNHLHWKATGKPMPNFTMGNTDPVLIEGESEVAKEFNGFIQRTNKEYQELIMKHGLGESLTFLGKKKS